MAYAKNFFELGYYFAHRIHQVTGMSIGDSLLNYTNFYLRFGLERTFDPSHPTWQAYLAGLNSAADPVDWTYTFYREQERIHPAQVEEPTFGFFSYAVWPGQRIRLHFHSPGSQDVGPLSRSEMVNRLRELTQLCNHVKSHVPNATLVLGGSWLYNLEAYRRLFPPAFLATIKPSFEDYQFMALWGQFLDHHGQVRPAMAVEFLEKVNAAASLEELKHAFPYPVQRLECGVEIFYRFYRVGIKTGPLPPR